MSIHSTVKPSGSSSARSISPTALTPSMFSEPLFWLTQRFEHRDGPLLLGIDGRGSSRASAGDELRRGGSGSEERERGKGASEKMRNMRRA